MSKRLVACCDGTWNRQDQGHPTNVTKLHAALVLGEAGGREQRATYLSGVGTTRGERLRGGAFGWGLSGAVTQTYQWIAENYAPGDELFLFGFSRGAYTARSTAGLLRNCGVPKKPTDEHLRTAYAIYRSSEPPDGPRAAAFRTAHAHPPPPIRFIGVWDTVGALGIPVGDNWLTRRINRRWGFHDTDLSRSVEHAYHALAIDERRKPFSPTLWHAPEDAPAEQKVEQVWFSGVHSDVGGGFARSGLSDLALLWLAERAEDAGLVFSLDALTPGRPAGGGASTMRISPNALSAMHGEAKGLARLVPRGSRDDIGKAERGHEALAASAVLRSEQDGAYRPANLVDALRRDVRQAPLPRRVAGGEPG
ncbi:uncharacterized protein (DUF2235 family) [Mumia flava]|uniref:Uncharacterized protein (DUF2235 family) n=1 Tax=Mumia flava TaxID=1348852 RepID=A0A2M9B614_9ACTN|nr:DUF2235 domain-containing protein [Mumia flava]PJJ53384.1 uncharacterized protein (DUF2235 family) [Mumia flava]